MYLKKLYTEPSLFEPIIFCNWINFIFGAKPTAATDEKEQKKSLNWIWKSLCLDFINFCLLSNESERIALAKRKWALGWENCVLEFEIDDVTYTIKRRFSDPNAGIVFGTKEEKNTYKLVDLKRILGSFIFNDYSKESINYKDSYYRELMNFFIKVESNKKWKFVDPIRYYERSREIDVNVIHFFLLELNNLLLQKKKEVVDEMDDNEKVQVSVEKFLRSNYKLDISETKNKIDDMSEKLDKSEKMIKEFKLSWQFDNIQNELNQLTEIIKSKRYEILSSKDQLSIYEESIKLPLPNKIWVIRIENLYNQVNTLLAQNVKKTLKDAIEFRQGIEVSRKKFLKEEMDKLNKIIKELSEEVESQEGERTRLYSILQSKEAISDLSESYFELNMKKAELSRLQSQIILHTQAEENNWTLSVEDSKLNQEIARYINWEAQSKIQSFRKYFKDLFESIYGEDREDAVFDITTTTDTKEKVNIKVQLPRGLSKGMNHGRTLIYDLSVLLRRVMNKDKWPMFLIHDGIFDGMYVWHFIHLYKCLKELSKKYKFQYIVTFNEVWQLDKSYWGKSNKDFQTEVIAKEAIKILWPNNKLLPKSF